MSPGNPVLPIPSNNPANQAQTSRLPPGTLDRVANILKAEKNQLSTLSVESSVLDLYFAVSEYAALSCPANEPNPLVVDVRDAFEPAVEKQSEDDTNNLWAAFKAINRKRSIRGGKGTGKRKAQFPKYKLGYGEFTIVWPPPPELEAEKVSADRVFRMKGKPSEPTSDGESKEEDCPSRETTAEGEDGSVEEGIFEQPITIYLIHYTCGEPYLNRMDKFICFKEILLVTKASTEALQEFTHQVMRWRIDKDHREGGLNNYPLYRFKTECDTRGWWESEGLKRARPIESVVLVEGQLDMIMNDVKKFLSPSTKSWYVKHGLPHRRSLLFYGPPGTGKTSTVRAVASAFGLSCCFLSMTNAGFSNQVLGDALSQIPPNALLILEDVDALFNLDRKSESSPSLTFSGLLNALDGVISTDGVITIMTTNHLDRLDSALVRGGRVDRRFYFGHPNVEQLRELFMVFYPQADKDIARKFVEKVMDRAEGVEARSIATLQQLFIHMREGTPEECVEAVDDFFKFHFPGEVNSCANNKVLYI